MKIRNGFVSNSSSSSFIICLPRMPESVEDMRSILFPNGEVSIPEPYDDGHISTLLISKRVFCDIKEKKSLSNEEMCEFFRRGSQYDFQGLIDCWPKYPEDTWMIKDHKERMIVWEEYRERVEDAAKKAANVFSEENHGSIIFGVTYADDHGTFEAAMEHGDIFRSIPHIKISHH